MYYKQSKGKLLVHKLTEILQWFRWTHHSEGNTHCEECLKLDGCWFPEGKIPQWPHHPFCHCTLDPIDYAIVLMNVVAKSDYSKFDPYLFNTTGKYPHNKEKLFNSWGYTVDDAHWLKTELEQQALEKYSAGDYELGKLDKNGQRIDIRVTIPRKDGIGTVSFITGWMIQPNGQIRLNTPYGGK